MWVSPSEAIAARSELSRPSSSETPTGAGRSADPKSGHSISISRNVLTAPSIEIFPGLENILYQRNRDSANQPAKVVRRHSQACDVTREARPRCLWYRGTKAHRLTAVTPMHFPTRAG